MEKPTIVTLDGSNEQDSTLTFEQAFGDYSEARGRRRGGGFLARMRAKRQARRIERIRMRAERKRARQQMRAEQQEARQMRKDTRKSRRVARKSMGDDGSDDAGSEDSGSEDSGSGSGSGSGYGSSTQDTTEEPPSSNDGNGEGEYQTTQDGDYEAGVQEEEQVDNEQGISDEESGFTGEVSFDGTIAMSEDDVRWNEYFSSAEGSRKINPEIKKLARKIEQTKEFISRIENNLRGLIIANADKTKIAHIRKQLAFYRNRLANLEGKLAGYSSFEGDYSEARGGRRAVSRRKAEVRHAKREARKERKAVIRANRKNARLERRGRGVTEVESGLNPELGDNSIEVPADETSSFSAQGTGLIGLDEQYDIDAPETRKFDLNFSNADGSTLKSLNIKNIAIGVAIGVVAVILIKKLSK